MLSQWKDKNRKVKTQTFSISAAMSLWQKVKVNKQVTMIGDCDI